MVVVAALKDSYGKGHRKCGARRELRGGRRGGRMLRVQSKPKSVAVVTVVTVNRAGALFHITLE